VIAGEDSVADALARLDAAVARLDGAAAAASSRAAVARTAQIEQNQAAARGLDATIGRLRTLLDGIARG
jgi:hypothetical protein